MTDKKLKIEFAPGCFDHFDGTQEELDEIMKMLEKMASTGEISDELEPIEWDELDEETQEALEKIFNEENEPRRLQ